MEKKGTEINVDGTKEMTLKIILLYHGSDNNSLTTEMTTHVTKGESDDFRKGTLHYHTSHMIADKVLEDMHKMGPELFLLKMYAQFQKNIDVVMEELKKIGTEIIPS